MARILEYPAVKQIDAKHWKLLEDLEYHVGSEDSDEVIIVPTGYETDFASVPRAFWNIFPPFGKHSPAAVIHDYLYGKQGVMPSGMIYSRRRCDEIFLETMGVMGVSWWRKHTMYRAVQMFGWVAWKKGGKTRTSIINPSKKHQRKHGTNQEPQN